MAVALIVVEPFGDHQKGEVITDADAVEEHRGSAFVVAFDYTAPPVGDLVPSTNGDVAHPGSHGEGG